MKAMVLAAGRGTRLRPLTDTRPKALVEIEGRTLLEIVLTRLRDTGVTDVVVNLHHLGDQIETFVGNHGGFGLRVAFSREAELLDTGGGLKNAGRFFDDVDAEGILVHNVDVLSDVDLGAVLRAHAGCGALATLVAKMRPTARPLLFDDGGALCGRVLAGGGEEIVREPCGALMRLGYCGIQVVSPRLFARLRETGAFSIVDAYLRLAGEGDPARLFRADDARWRDAGRPEDLRPL
jgi:NDP-sugar pyrophosphorylase family protein